MTTGEVTTRHLTLMRHAKTEPLGSTGTDFDRSLSLDGRRQASAVAERLREHGALPDLVLCSAAVRARQTWQLIAAALGAQAHSIEVRSLEELYGADTGEILDLVRTLDDSVASVLVVGHEPVISALAHLLAGANSQEAATFRVRTGMSTATLAFLEVRGPWSGLRSRSAVLTGLATTPAH